MKKNNKTYSPYATNKGGIILSPKGKQEAPKAVTVKGNDLRVKGG